VVVLFFWSVACAPATESARDGSAETGKDAGSVAPDGGRLLGGFSLSTSPSDRTASVTGQVWGGEIPALLQWTKVATVGDCTFVTPNAPFCSTSCGTGVCVATDTCQAKPSRISVGDVTVSGVKTETGATTFTLAKTSSHAYSSVAGLTYPPFAENDAVRFSASGGDSAAFDLETKGIAPLDVTTHDILISSGSNAVVKWTAAQGGNSTVTVLLDLSHHGGTKGQIRCETADDGTLQIDSSLITSLLNLGATGSPWIVITRKAEGKAAIALGNVSLSLTSEVTEVVDVPGIVSCSQAEDGGARTLDGGSCPTGQTCLTSLYMCG